METREKAAEVAQGESHRKAREIELPNRLFLETWPLNGLFLQEPIAETYCLHVTCRGTGRWLRSPERVFQSHDRLGRCTRKSTVPITVGTQEPNLFATATAYLREHFVYDVAPPLRSLEPSQLLHVVP